MLLEPDQIYDLHLRHLNLDLRQPLRLERGNGIQDQFWDHKCTIATRKGQSLSNGV